MLGGARWTEEGAGPGYLRESVQTMVGAQRAVRCTASESRQCRAPKRQNTMLYWALADMNTMYWH